MAFLCKWQFCTVCCFMVAKSCTAPTANSTSETSTVSGHSGAYSMFIQQEVTGLVNSLSILNWTHINIFTDIPTGDRIEVFIKQLTDQTTAYLTLTRSTDPSYFQRLKLMRIFSHDKHAIKRLFLIMCSHQCVTMIQKRVRVVSSPSFMFQSTWLIITDNISRSMIVHGGDRIAVVSPKLSGRCVFHTLKIHGDIRQFTNMPGRELCQWNKELWDILLLPNSNGSLRGRTLKVGIAEWSSYVIQSVDPNNSSKVTYKGLLIDLLDELQSALDFQIQFISRGEEQNYWTKFYSMLTTQEIDILVAPLFQTRERMDTMDFTYPILFDSVNFVYREPPREETRWRLILDVISWRVVLITCAVLLTTSLTLSACKIVNRFFYSDQVKILSITGYCRLLGQMCCRQVFELFGNVLKQGHVLHSFRVKTVSSERYFLSAWYIFCLILTISLTAHLVPVFGVYKQARLFRNIEDLINNDLGYKWGTYGDGNAMLEYLKNSQEDNKRILYRKMMEFYDTDPEVLSNSVSVHRRKILEEKYAYFASLITVYKAFPDNCDVQKFDKNVMVLPMAIPIAKNSPYTEIISNRVMRLHENGQLQKLFQKWFPPKKKCVMERTTLTALDLVYLQSVFVLMAVGIVLSLFVLGLEIMCSKCLQKIQEKLPSSEGGITINTTPSTQ